ncbi:MAG: sigma-70 family RNA polymerase sigma factor [Prevotellaceae bacterium]|nr:sigma-70 family RNA polymerase sigma factor [Prevotellaceae bacterium]
MTDEEIGELFRSTYPRLYRLAYSLLDDQEESKDVVSGIFMEILDKHILARDINTYLISMVRNRALDILRHRQVKDSVWADLLQEHEQSITSDTPDEEQINEIRLFIEKELTPQTRRILQCCYDDKKSYKEVASELGISVQAVNKHISQALRKLRERFNPSFKTN